MFSFPSIPLPQAIFQALSQDPKRTVVIEHREGVRRTINAAQLLSVGLNLGQLWKKTLTGNFIGVALPPGIGSLAAHVGLWFAGKVPVNFNLTLPVPLFEACMEQVQCDTFISVKMVQDRFSHLPWPKQTLDIRKEIAKLSRIDLGLKWGMASLGLGKWLHSKAIANPDIEELATILFTSGSEKAPKGVMLSHKNLLTNVQQIARCEVFPDRCRVMASLPVFHSFGFTTTLLYSLLEPITIVTGPAPLDAKGIAECIFEEKVSVHLGTPTFFRPYFKNVPPEKLKSLTTVVSGAEKTPEGFADAWEKQFGSLYLEGYGITETAPVVAVNLPYPNKHLRGSVGQLLQGIEVRIISPETGLPLPLFEKGLIELKGDNICQGYWKDPDATAKAFTADGFFKTNDIGWMDAHGFLFVEGRLLRFSKIAGEMISHVAIESALAKAYTLEEGDRPWIVVGRPDPTKGEQLVLVSERDIDLEDLRQRLLHIGLSNLWIPKTWVKVDALPTLASGKCDLKACKQLALES